MIIFLLAALHMSTAFTVQPPVDPTTYREACPGATHFYNYKTEPTPPSWAKGRKPLCTFGVHRFYSDPPAPKTNKATK